jgi:hypothetical protein
MASPTGTEGRESGTGQDTPKVCVHVPPRFPLRPTGHDGTLSRPVPLSRILGRPCWPAWTRLVPDECGGPYEGPQSPHKDARDSPSDMVVAEDFRTDENTHSSISRPLTASGTRLGLGTSMMAVSPKYSSMPRKSARRSKPLRVTVLLSHPLPCSTASHVRPSAARSHETAMAPRLGRLADCSICLPSKSPQVGSRAHESAAPHSRAWRRYRVGGCGATWLITGRFQFS